MEKLYVLKGEMRPVHKGIHDPEMKRETEEFLKKYYKEKYSEEIVGQFSMMYDLALEDIYILDGKVFKYKFKHFTRRYKEICKGGMYGSEKYIATSNTPEFDCYFEQIELTGKEREEVIKIIDDYALSQIKNREESEKELEEARLKEVSKKSEKWLEMYKNKPLTSKRLDELEEFQKDGFLSDYEPWWETTKVIPGGEDLLEDIIESYGFEYDPDEDIFESENTTIEVLDFQDDSFEIHLKDKSHLNGTMKLQRLKLL